MRAAGIAAAGHDAEVAARLLEQTTAEFLQRLATEAQRAREQTAGKRAEGAY